LGGLNLNVINPSDDLESECLININVKEVCHDNGKVEADAGINSMKPFQGT
jgi:hypothetical protein